MRWIHLKDKNVNINVKAQYGCRCVSALKLWIWSPALHKPGIMVAHTCTRTQDVALGESAVQGHPQLQIEFEEAILGYEKPGLKNRTKGLER